MHLRYTVMSESSDAITVQVLSMSAYSTDVTAALCQQSGVQLLLVLCEDVHPCTAEKFEEGKNFHLHETHFDIIMDVPPIVTVLGSSKNTPVQMCCVADHFLGKCLPCHSVLEDSCADSLLLVGICTVLCLLSSFGKLPCACWLSDQLSYLADSAVPLSFNVDVYILPLIFSCALSYKTVSPSICACMLCLQASKVIQSSQTSTWKMICKTALTQEICPKKLVRLPSRICMKML